MLAGKAVNPKYIHTTENECHHPHVRLDKDMTNVHNKIDNINKPYENILYGCSLDMHINPSEFISVETKMDISAKRAASQDLDSIEMVVSFGKHKN